MRKNKKGFCLLETLVCLLIAGLATGGILWCFSGIQNGMKAEDAKVKAAMIQTAKSVYKDIRGTEGTRAYEGKPDDQKFLLLREFIPLTGTSTLAVFTPKGFQFRLNGINQKVTILYNNQEIRY